MFSSIWLRCSGALFFSIWRPSVFDFFGSFDVVLDGLWAPRLWSGRFGPGSVFSNFLGRHFWSQNGHLDATQTHKNKRFSGHLCAKGDAQKSLEVSLVLPNVTVFPCFFANSGGRLSGPNGPVDTFWICSVASVAWGGVFYTFSYGDSL